MAGEVTVDLRPQWDTAVPLANPHKGWYHHYFDNSIDKYLVNDDREVTGFTGMDHIYLRLAWSYLEPEEGRYNWRVIDEQIEKWTASGMGISFRISCKETGTNRIEQQFATPSWVRDAGAKGNYYYRGKEMGPGAPWEPVYDDPVFIRKLDAFLAAFAGRYDGKPWLRYVDIGSFGDWGEGHTSSGSGIKYAYAVMEQHVNLHIKHFKKTMLVISDDYVASLANQEDRQRLRAKIVEHGISYRDDSILVDWYVTAHSKNFTVRSPELFEEVWKARPTVFELEHYGTVKHMGNWLPRQGSSLEKFGNGRSGADYFRGAMELLHATYIGYHGYAREWFADNPELTVELLNRCGYWFFPHAVTLPEELVAGQAGSVHISWQNRGVAPAYYPYTLILRLEGQETIDREFISNNTRWLPGPDDTLWNEAYALEVPETQAPGNYNLKFKLYSAAAGRDVKLPIKTYLLDSKGFYSIGPVKVVRKQK